MKIILLSKIFLWILIIFSFYACFFVVNAETSNFQNSEEGAVLDQVRGRDYDVTSTTTSSLEYLIPIWIVIGIVSISIFIYGLISHKITLRSFGHQNIYSSQEEVSKDAIKRDTRRKEDLQKIVEALTKFHEQNNHYPDAKTDEFKNLLSSLHSVPHDPLENKQQKEAIQKYGYYYDNQNDPQYYKLWCILENPQDSEAQHYYNNTLHLYLKTAPKETSNQIVETSKSSGNVENITDEHSLLLNRDIKRKEDLRKIQELLKSFYQTNNRYPNESEYTGIIVKTDQSIIDPRQGTDSGFNDQKYGYYYDNLKLDENGQTINDDSTYRLWCLLENKDDPEILHDYDSLFHWILMKTQQS